MAGWWIALRNRIGPLSETPLSWWIGAGAAVAALGVSAALLLRGGDAAPGARPSATAAAVASPVPIPSPSPPPRVVTDGCRGLVSAAQVARASGLPVAASAGDGAGAVTQYGNAVQSLGLDAEVRLCPFDSAAGDQVTVAALVFPDAAQAGRLFDTARGAAALQPVTGVGDAAVTDRTKTLLVRRGKTVVAVYLVATAAPDANHLPALQSVAALIG